MENYYQRRIRNFTSSQDSSQYLLLEHALRKTAAFAFDDIQEIDHDFYAVKSESSDEYYFIDPKLGLCSCPVGAFGSFCKHQAALYRYKRIGLPSMPAVTPEDRHEMAMLAFGESARDSDFYRRLDVSFSLCSLLLIT